MNIIEFIKNTVSRSLDKYLELHPDIPDGGTTGQVMVKKSDADGDIEWKNLIGSGWGVAKVGSFSVSGGSSITIDISDLGITNVNDYEVLLSLISTEATAGYVPKITKATTSFAVLTYGSNINFTYSYTVIAKGYGAADAGIHFEVGAEKWYGTYTENGVKYDVYSKIVYIPALPAEAGITNVPHGVTGIKQILAVQGFCSNSMIMNAPRQNVQDNISIYQVQKSGNIAIEVGKDRSSVSAYVTLIYAKNN